MWTLFVAILASLLVAPDQGQRRRVAILVESARPSQLQGLTRAAQGQLSDVAVTLEVVPVATLPKDRRKAFRLAADRFQTLKPLALLWVREEDQEACVLVETPKGTRQLCRVFPGSDMEALYEAAALVLRETVRGVLEGNAPGRAAHLPPLGSKPRPTKPRSKRSLMPAVVARPAVPASGHSRPRNPAGPLAPPPKRAPQRLSGRLSPAVEPALSVHLRRVPQTPRYQVRLSLGYGLDLAQAVRPALAHGVEAGIALLPESGWIVALSYRFEIPETSQSGPVTMVLWRHLLEAGAGHTWLVGRTRLGFFLGTDVVFATRDVDTKGTAAATASGPDVLSALSGYGVLSWSFARRFHVKWLMGLRVYVLVVRYVTHEGKTLEQPWQVQPSTRLELSVDLR